MNADFPQTPREAIEARLTALLLGELPVEEADSLQTAIAQDPGLAELYGRLKGTIDLVREIASGPAEHTASPAAPFRFSDQRREKLLAQFKTVAPTEFVQPRARKREWLVPASIAALLLAIGTVWLMEKAEPRFMLMTQLQRSEPEMAAVTETIASYEKSFAPVRGEDRFGAKRDDSNKKQPEASMPGKLVTTSIALPAAAKPVEAPLAGDPQWIGLLEKPGAPWSVSASGKDAETLSKTETDSFRRRYGLERRTEAAESSTGIKAKIVSADSLAQGHSATNRFISRYAYMVPPKSGDPAPFSSGAPGSPRAFDSDGIDGFSPGPLAPQPVSSQPPVSIILPPVGEASFALNAGVGTPLTAAGLPNASFGEQSRGRPMDAEKPRPYPKGSYYGPLPADAAAGVAVAKPQDTPALNYDNSTLSRATAPLDLPQSSADVMTWNFPVEKPPNIGWLGRTVAGAVALPAASNSSGAINQAPATNGVVALTLSTNFIGVSQNYALTAPTESFRRRYGGQGGAGGVGGGGGGAGGAAISSEGQRLADAVGAPAPASAAPMPAAPAIDPSTSRPTTSESLLETLRGIEPTTGLPVDLSRVNRPNTHTGSHPAPTRQLRGPSATEANSSLGVGHDSVDRALAAETSPKVPSHVSEAKSEQTPILGDVPPLEMAFNSGSMRKDIGGLASLFNDTSRTKAGEGTRGSTNVYNLDVVGYANVPTVTKASAALAGQNADRYTAPVLTGITTTLANKKALLNPQPPGKSTQSILLAEGQHEAGIEVLAIDDKAGRVTVKKSDAVGATTEETNPAGTVNFAVADLGEVQKIYSELAGRQLLRSNLSTGPVALGALGPLTKQDAIHTLDAVLALNGISMIPVGEKLMKAVPTAQANQTGASQVPEDRQSDRYVTHVFQLQSVKPSELLNVLTRAKVISNPAVPVDGNRILAVRENPENIRRLSELIPKIDANMAKSGSTLEAEVGRALTELDEPTKSRVQAPAGEPQPEVLVSENPFSTFSLNVSDVSFKLAAASLEKGQMPEPASIRSEEFINAFDYRDPEPLGGVPVAFAWERARYPFAHNRDLLRFAIKTAAAGRQAGRPLNIVLLLDNSGSMERADRVAIIREALRVLAGQLQPQDKLSVITFARTARLFVDGVAGDQAGRVAEEVSGLTPQGGTNLEEAMNLAYQTAARHYLPNGINRVVLLTDGAANLGDVAPESLKQKVETQRKQGIALDCFGIGWEGLNDDLLEILSRNGDGRYGFINTPEEAATEFAGQLAGALHVAASDVKVQIEFNPQRVAAYRQIGYAKHQLTKEQFRDNTVDAAEIGAAEAGNALYVIESNPAGQGPLAVVRVRFRVPGTSDYREHEWPVPYTGNAVALEQASPAIRLTATASAFSEWLVASPYAGEVTPDRLLGYLSGVPEVYGADGRAKKLEWMIRQAKSVSK